MNNNTNKYKLRFGVIGTSAIADKVIEAARLDNRFELTAVYSRTQEQADRFALKHHIPHTFTSLDEMATTSLIDAVYIASPNSCHASHSILFMDHGKHVLCEKPLASNRGEVRDMMVAARRNKVALMEAMKPTLTPGFQLVRDHLDKIGTVRRYFSSYCQYSSRYDKFKEGIVMNTFDPSLSNGALVDIGVYTIYPMVVLFGRPKSVNAIGFKLSSGVDGQGAVNFEYDGMSATVLYSKIADSLLPTEIQGEDGTITIDRINFIQYVKLKYRTGDITSISDLDNTNDYFFEIQEFINLVETGRLESEINSHNNSLITMEILDEIRKQLGVVFPADK